MFLGNFVVEVTRRCNFSCEHCLRGDSEDIDIDMEKVELFLIENKIDGIGSITFTGGEPFLNVSAIKEFIEICWHHKIEVQNFYIATNGSLVSNRILHILIDLYLYCSDNDISMVEISDTFYHDYEEQSDDAIDKLMFSPNKF